MLYSQSFDIGLCRLDAEDMSSAISYIRKMQSTARGGYVVTPNVDHLARLATNDNDGELQEIYRNAGLSLCDSRIVELLLKFHGKRLPEVVTGSDLTRRLFESEMTGDDHVYILGGEADAVKLVKSKYPNLRITHHNPSMGFINKSNEVEDIVRNITAANPNFVFLAVGSPQQERMAMRLHQNSNFRGVSLCIGASILFLAGKEKRAPGWLRTLRLEWLFRLIQNPGRLAIRYLNNALVLPKINRQLSQGLGRPATN
ncbi:WecB/TagA/CpsF family glycosyltransferase [Microbulbifer agarilyticus]